MPLDFSSQACTDLNVAIAFWGRLMPDHMSTTLVMMVMCDNGKMVSQKQYHDNNQNIAYVIKVL